MIELSQEDDVNEEIQVDSGFKCAFCFELKSSVQDMTEHIKSEHPDIVNLQKKPQNNEIQKSSFLSKSEDKVKALEDINNKTQLEFLKSGLNKVI